MCKPVSIREQDLISWRPCQLTTSLVSDRTFLLPDCSTIQPKSGTGTGIPGLQTCSVGPLHWPALFSCPSMGIFQWLLLAKLSSPWWARSPSLSSVHVCSDYTQFASQSLLQSPYLDDWDNNIQFTEFFWRNENNAVKMKRFLFALTEGASEKADLFFCISKFLKEPLLNSSPNSPTKQARRYRLITGLYLKFLASGI